MTYFIWKTVVSAVLVTFISEVARRKPWAGALLASLPVVSVLGMIWLYAETRDGEKVAEFSMDVFWLILPSLLFFPLLSVLLRRQVGFVAGLAISMTVMVVAYWFMAFVGGKMGVRV